MRQRAMWVAIAAALIAGGACGGGSSRPAGTVSRPGASGVGGGDASAAIPSIAIIPVHVTYQLSALRPVLDSLLPDGDSLTRNACAVARGLVCHRYVYRRTPFVLTANGANLSLSTDLRYRAALGAPGVDRVASCGYAPEEMRRATFAMTTSLYWRRDWKIGARSTHLTATLVDACRVSFVGVDATPTLSSLLNRQLARFGAQADTAIPLAADLEPLADSLWRSFQQPTPLDSAGTLWLVVEPTDVRVTSFVGVGASIRTSLTLYARPRVVAGGKPRPAGRSLPPVQLGEASDQYDVPLRIELPYADIERRATQFLRDDTKSGSVRIDTVRVATRGDSLSIALDVRGTIEGRLTLLSRPHWDPAARQITLDDLDWSLESRGLLSRVKSTLASPLISRAVRRATLGGRVPVGAQLDSARAELMRKLNGPVSPGVAMASSVTAVSITGVALSPSAIVVNARVRGDANVYIR